MVAVRLRALFWKTFRYVITNNESKLILQKGYYTVFFYCIYQLG